MQIMCEPFDSALWETYRGAYGNVCEDVQMLMGAKPMLPQKREEETDEQIAFDNLCETLWHQMSFYRATYLAMPYMVQFLEQKSSDFSWEYTVLCGIGGILATDVPWNIGETEIPIAVQESYAASVALLKEKAVIFLNTYPKEIKALEDDAKSELFVALLAILGSPEIAYFWILNAEEFYLACDACEYCSEEDEEAEYLSQITPASELPQNEVYLGYKKLFCDFEIERELVLLSNYLGTFTCPECGKTKPVLECMETYFGE